jgi:hypothetical protein
MVKLYKVTYKVVGIIAAGSESDLKRYAIICFNEIVDDWDYESREAEELPVKHNYVDDYIPYGDNPRNLTLCALENYKENNDFGGVGFPEEMLPSQVAAIDTLIEKTKEESGQELDGPNQKKQGLLALMYESAEKQGYEEPTKEQMQQDYEDAS